MEEQAPPLLASPTPTQPLILPPGSGIEAPEWEPLRERLRLEMLKPMAPDQAAVAIFALSILSGQLKSTAASGLLVRPYHGNTWGYALAISGAYGTYL